MQLIVVQTNLVSSLKMHLLVDYSKIVVYKVFLKRFFSVEVEPKHQFFCLNSIAD